MDEMQSMAVTPLEFRVLVRVIQCANLKAPERECLHDQLPTLRKQKHRSTVFPRKIKRPYVKWCLHSGTIRHLRKPAESTRIIRCTHLWARNSDLTLETLYIEWNPGDGKKKRPLERMTTTDGSGGPQSFTLPHALEEKTYVRFTAEIPQDVALAGSSSGWRGFRVVASDDKRAVRSKSSWFWA